MAVGSSDLELSANARYSDDYSISQYNNPRTFQSSYTMIDAAARLAFGEGWEAALIGRNLTDEFVIMGTLDVVGTGAGTGTAVGVPADQAGLVGLPRTVQVQFTKRF
jgi:iron complex outermembrane receptor protein